MPNWCFTSLFFFSKNREELQQMLQDFVSVYSGPSSSPNDFGHGWMVDYVRHYFPRVNWHDADARGQIAEIDTSLELQDGYFRFKVTTATAWNPKVGLWFDIVERHYPNVSIAYESEESGCGIFLRYDPQALWFDDQYVLDAELRNKDGDICYPESNYAKNLGEIITWLKSVDRFNITQTEDFRLLAKEIQGQLDDDEFLSIEAFTDDDPSSYQSIIGDVVLPDDKYNALQRIISATKTDCWFDIVTEDGSDRAYDLEQDKLIPWSTAIYQLMDAIDDYAECGISDDDARLMVEIIRDFDIDPMSFSANIPYIAEEGAENIVWLKERGYAFDQEGEDDEVYDIISDLKPYFDELTHGTIDQFDEWYDEVSEQYILPHFRKLRDGKRWCK